LSTSVNFPVSRTLKHAGTHRVVYALAKELRQMGVTVTICCSGDSDEMGGARAWNGRALFYVYTQAGESVAEKLIREGLGKAWERDGQHRELLMAVKGGVERNSNRGLC